MSPARVHCISIGIFQVVSRYDGAPQVDSRLKPAGNTEYSRHANSNNLNRDPEDRTTTGQESVRKKMMDKTLADSYPLQRSAFQHSGSLR